MKKLFLSFVLLLNIVIPLTFIESFIFFLPVTLFYLVIVSIYHRQVFPLAFLGGLSIDILQVKTLGTTSVIFLLALLLIFLYKRKVESSALFTSLAVFLSASSYSYFAGQVAAIALFQGMLLTFPVFVVTRIFRPIFEKK